MQEKPSYEELQRKIAELETQVVADRQALTGRDELLQRYSDLVENASDLIHSVTPDGRFLYVNKAWKNTLGYTDEEVKTLKLFDIIEERSREKCRDVFKCLIEGERVDRNETVFVAKDGQKILVEGRCTTKFKGGKAVLMIGIFRDIGERVRNEDALRESEQRYRDLFENAHDLIQIVRPDGKLLFVNRAWRETFGYNPEEIEHLSIFDIISPECLDHCMETFHRVISEEKVHNIGDDTVFVTKDGRRIAIEGNACCKFQDGQPVSTQCIFRDVTEKKRMEAELLKAQKLESVGIFAGGIAHDFNNLLTAILGNISLAKMLLKPEDPVFNRLEMMEKASRQAQGLTQQLLTFSKGGAPIKKITSIEELIRDSCSFTLRGGNVRCEYQMAEGLWPIEVDEGQLSQVTQNLVINACQAMPAGGVLTIRAANFVSDEENGLGLPAGRYVEISFIDQGSGIARENLAKIFDPYFSSKQTGSGLGLAVAYSIIKKHEGLITVDSQPGRGAIFTIYLPASDKTLPPEKQSDESAAPTGKGRILIMDDEEIVREIAAEMLHYLGCLTEMARDGEEAIAMYVRARNEGNPFDAVLMDLTIAGGMGGREAIARLLEIDPEIRAVVSSGYANDPIMANYRQYGFCGVVPKPYKLHDLSSTLCAIFQAKEESEG